MLRAVPGTFQMLTGVTDSCYYLEKIVREYAASWHHRAALGVMCE